MQQPVMQKKPLGQGGSPGRPHACTPGAHRSPPPPPPVPLPPVPLPPPPVPKQSGGRVVLPKHSSQRPQLFMQSVTGLQG